MNNDWRTVFYFKNDGTIIDYNDAYEVNSDSIIRVKKQYGKFKPGYILKQTLTAGYLQVHLKDGYRLVNRIVAFAFPEICGMPEPFFDVDHLDDNPVNNKATNLRWISHAANNRKEHHKKLLSDYQDGKPKTIEHRRKIGLANKGKKLSAYTKNLLRIKHSIPVKQYDLNGNLIKSWSSSIEAEKAGIAPSASIRRVCKGMQNTAGGFVWREA